MSQESDLFDADTLDMLMNCPDIAKAVAEAGDEILNPSNALDKRPDKNATRMLPLTEEFRGPHLFEVEVECPDQYSRLLNKIFVEPNKTVPIKIKWDGTRLNLRGLLLFSDPDRFKDPVLRCSAHRDRDNIFNKNYEHVNHVVTCENDRANHEKNTESGRHSITLPLELTVGTNFSLVLFKFMCLNSCTGGINRSSTVLVLTLEDESGQVWGRQKINIRICSVPKREMKAEERKRQMEIDEGMNIHGKKKRKLKGELHQVSNKNNSSTSTQILVTTENEEDKKLVLDCLKKLNEETVSKRGGPPPISKLGFFCEEKF